MSLLRAASGERIGERVKVVSLGPGSGRQLSVTVPFGVDHTRNRRGVVGSAALAVRGLASMISSIGSDNATPPRPRRRVRRESRVERGFLGEVTWWAPGG